MVDYFIFFSWRVEGGEESHSEKNDGEKNDDEKNYGERIEKGKSKLFLSE